MKGVPVMQPLGKSIHILGGNSEDGRGLIESQQEGPSLCPEDCLAQLWIQDVRSVSIAITGANIEEIRTVWADGKRIRYQSLLFWDHIKLRNRKML